MKKINNAANMQNANKGLPGINKQSAQNQGNRGQQLNPFLKKTKESTVKGKAH